MVVCDYRKKLCFALDILIRNYFESGKLVNVAVVCNVAVYKESIEIVVFAVCFCNSISELCCLFEPVASDAGGSFKMRVAACDKTDHRGELCFILGSKATYK